MTTLKYRHLERIPVLLGALTLVAPALAETTGDNGSHDPSRMIQSEGRFYVFSTGADAKSSADGLDWAREPSIIPRGFPSWVDELLPTGNQGVWAPGIIYYRDQFLLYFSVCGVPAAGAPCAIGLLTSPTLNSSSADYGWTDRGLVLTNPHNSDAVQYSTIDAAPIVDTNGDLWLVWGSGYGKDRNRDQLFITRLDNATGLPLASDPSFDPPATPGHPLTTGEREGPYMHYHDGYYYLFWNTGSCCSGTASDYTIWVSRSTEITGPFTGERIFYANTGNINGPGHMGIYSACGEERFTYHYYPTNWSILGVNQLTWSSDGWPEVGPESTQPLAPCDEPVDTWEPSGGAGGAGNEAGSGGVGTAGSSPSGGAATTAGAAGMGGTGPASTGGTTASGGSPDEGGATAMGGTAGSGAPPLSGGAPPTGGVSSGGAQSPGGGSPGAGSSGVTGTVETAGSPAIGATGGTGTSGAGSAGGTSGAVPPGSASSEQSDSSGCSCSVPGERRRTGELASLLAFMAAGLAWGRRRGGRSEPRRSRR